MTVAKISTPRREGILVVKCKLVDIYFSIRLLISCQPALRPSPGLYTIGTESSLSRVDNFFSRCVRVESAPPTSDLIVKYFVMHCIFVAVRLIIEFFT